MNAITEIANANDKKFAAMARASLEAVDGMSEAAIDHLANVALRDREFIEANLSAIVRTWAAANVAHALNRFRRVSVAPPAAVDGSIFNAAVQANYKRFMERPLWGGKPIGNATAAEILASADSYQRQAHTMTKEAEWQSAVAAALGKNGNAEDRVCDCLTEATLAKLWEEKSGN